MKIKIIYLLAALSFLAAANAIPETGGKDEWYPFVISEKLDPDSPANIGKLVLDPPAGKHGFVKVKDGHFYFEDGTRAKFWGTNLCFSACFPSKKQAEVLAKRLAFFGFNAVRLHHMDFYFEPEGIFEDTNPASNDPQSKKTTKLSERQLERLDYLIYQLKIRGIYVDMNLLVSRHFTKADGVIDADKLKMAAKPLSMFDNDLIALQKQYAMNLFTHYNPYTKLRYCDDPAIALVEITNENSLFMSGDAELPRYYAEEMQNLRKEWLGEAGKTDKITKNDFYMYLEKKFFRGMTNFLKNNCGVKVPITGIGGYWNTEDAEAQESCDFLDAHDYWDHPKFPHTAWDRKDFAIQDRSVLLDEDLGIVGGVLRLSQISKNKPYTITEWNHCYPNKYAYETPLLLAAKAHENDWDGLFQFAFKHSIHPALIFDNIDYYFDAMNNPQQLILLSLASAVFLGKEKITTRNIEGIFYINSKSLRAAVGFIKDKTLSLGDFTITPDRDGAVMLYKGPGGFLLASVSEVKNTDSGWDASGRFNWGESPVLLKKIGLECQSINKNNFRVYELDEEGRRRGELKITSTQNRHFFSTLRARSPWFEIKLD